MIEHYQMYDMRRTYLDPNLHNMRTIALTGDALMAMFLYYAKTKLPLR